MPTYTPEQLKEGVDLTSFDGETTFTFTNPGNSSYFFIEQNTGKNPNGSINVSSTSYTAGTFTNLTGIPTTGIVQNNFKFGIVIPPGDSSITFTPTDTSGGGSIKLRGTGTIELSTAAASGLLLDLYSDDVVAAYSLRKLSTSYGVEGSAIRVRRTSDDAETNIGFDSEGNLDTSTLLTFVGTGNDGHIVTWYDQSGNGRNATNSTNSEQPLIAESSGPSFPPSIVGINGKPTIKNGGGINSRVYPSNLPLVTQPLTFFDVFAETSTSGATFNRKVFNGVSSNAKPTNRIQIQRQTIPKMPSLFTTNTSGDLITTTTSGTPNDTNLHVHTTMVNEGSSVFRTDQSNLSFTNNPAADASFGGPAAGAGAEISFGQQTFLSEIIIYNANKASDFTNIEGNMKAYYSTP